MTRIEQTRIVSVLAEIKRQLWIFLEHVWESLAHIGIQRHLYYGKNMPHDLVDDNEKGTLQIPL